MNDRIQGIILKQSDYRDQAVLLRVLTRDHGKLSLIAQGARKMTSRNAGRLQPYTQAVFLLDYREGRTLFRLRSLQDVRQYERLYTDLYCSAAAAVLCEAADGLCAEETDAVFCQPFYEDLSTALEDLSQGFSADLVLTVCLAQFLQYSGMAPAVDGCAVCGESRVTAISAREGGFLCARHAQELQVPARDPKRLHQFRLLNKAGMSRISQIAPLVDDCREDLAVLVEILRTHGGLAMHSCTLLQQVAAIEERH